MQVSEECKNEKTAFSRIKSIIWFILRISIGAGIITYMIIQNREDLINVFGKIKYEWIVLATVLYLTHLLVCAWRWLVLLKIQKINLNYFEATSLMMQGFFFSLVIPGGAIGGDLVKAGILASRSPKGSKLEGTLTILVDRIIGMIALFSLTLVVAVFSINQITRLEGLVLYVSLLIICACFAGLGCTLVLYYHRTLEKIKVFAWGIELGDKYSGGMLSRVSNALDLFRDSWKTIVLWVVISMVFVHLNIILIVFVILRSLGQSTVTFANIVFGTVFGMVAGLIPISPQGVGIRDKVMQDIFTLGGLHEGVATAIPLIFTTFVLAFSLIGGLLFIFQPAAKMKIDKEPEKEPTKNS